MTHSIDSLVDRFVEAVNQRQREPLDVGVKNPPRSVLIGEIDEYGNSDWQVKADAGIDWIEQLEEKRGSKFPLIYRSLIVRYIFPSFEAGGLWFFGNTPEGTDFHELRDRVSPDTGDKALNQALSKSGYLQFAQPAGGDYDPVCFDLNRGTNRDRPIVRIDHEWILCDNVVKVTEDIATSFHELIERFLG